MEYTEIPAPDRALVDAIAAWRELPALYVGTGEWIPGTAEFEAQSRILEAAASFPVDQRCPTCTAIRAMGQAGTAATTETYVRFELLEALAALADAALRAVPRSRADAPRCFYCGASDPVGRVSPRHVDDAQPLACARCAQTILTTGAPPCAPQLGRPQPAALPRGGE